MPVKPKEKIEASKARVMAYKGVSFDEIIQKMLDSDELPASLVKAVMRRRKTKKLPGKSCQGDRKP